VKGKDFEQVQLS